MANNTVKLLDVVALTVDRPEYNLRRGQVGTVVETLADGAAFEVEFSDREGKTYESLGLRPEQIMVLRFEPAIPEFEAITPENLHAEIDSGVPVGNEFW